MCTESVLHNAATTACRNGTDGEDVERLRKYKAFSIAFAYPRNGFFEFFAMSVSEQNDVRAEYDRLFRAGNVWLEGAEHMAENEFQRANLLADIMGFYKAFGVEPDADRPDALSCELEFMHCLITKKIRAAQGKAPGDKEEKVEICRDAEGKFFREHLEPAARQIAEKIISMSNQSFYVQAATDLLAFVKSENHRFQEGPRQ